MNDETEEALTIENLPDVPLIHIFSFLSPRERFKFGSVCRRWYNLSKGTLWKHLDVRFKKSEQFLKLLPFIPPHVENLRLSCESTETMCNCVFPELLSTIFSVLNNRCPGLKTLVLHTRWSYQRGCPNPYLDVRGCKRYPYLVREIMYPFRDIYLKRRIKAKYRCLPELQVLSLRIYNYDLGDFLYPIKPSLLPKIKVMDFSTMFCSADGCIELFSGFSNLTELYLPATQIDNLKITTSKGLKVLDIDEVHDIETLVPDLRLYGQSLEKLYLAEGGIRDADLAALVFDNENSFPRLTYVCLRHTRVTYRGVEALLNSCHSLERVDVTGCPKSGYADGFSDLDKYLPERFPDKMRRKLIYSEDEVSYLCDHFMKVYFPGE